VENVDGGFMTIQEALQTALKHFRSGQYAEAENICRQVLGQVPDQPDALHLLGLIALRAKQVDAALELFTRAVGINPMMADFQGNHGLALALKGRIDEAMGAFGRALKLRPAYPEALFNLGDALCVKEQWQEAIAMYERAAAIRPHDAVSHRNIGNALMRIGKWEKAIEHCELSLAMEPFHAETHNTIGIARQGMGDFDGAKAEYQKAMELKPNCLESLNNLANVYRDTGHLRKALEYYQKTLDVDGTRADIASNLLYGMHYDPAYDSHALLERHREWDERYAKPLRRALVPLGNERSAERRLKIGYVSADFCGHVVGVSLLPLLSRHDHSQFEVYAYSGVMQADMVTEALRKQCDVWRDIRLYSDEQLADLIRADGIDILVDLTQHMAHNRLLTFARKPAPVQVSYLGYCSTTGVGTMDYRFSDPYLDPPGSDLSCYSEETVRLPRTYWCYQPRGSAEVGPSPALASGYVTFGCMNSFSKVSPATMELWAELMRRVAGSRLILHCRTGGHRNDVLEFFESRGVGRERVELIGMQGWPQYIRTYQRIDIGLDPFPYCGGITTCDALWMGVPVVTLSGRTAVGRGGCSILSNLGLGELVAGTEQEYVELAMKTDRWIQLRGSLRRRMEESPLMDGAAFARGVEAAYREMWRKWARAGRTSDPGRQE
jgi:protein O-GlcNAc transferase